ncbi:MAG: hypothetical protein ABIG95_01925, partial [Candidatus Woesearchaeota archaeon]
RKLYANIAELKRTEAVKLGLPADSTATDIKIEKWLKQFEELDIKYSTKGVISYTYIIGQYRIFENTVVFSQEQEAAVFRFCNEMDNLISMYDRTESFTDQNVLTQAIAFLKRLSYVPLRAMGAPVSPEKPYSMNKLPN